jgi:hypothetical protein
VCGALKYFPRFEASKTDCKPIDFGKVLLIGRDICFAFCLVATNTDSHAPNFQTKSPRDHGVPSFVVSSAPSVSTIHLR